MDDSTSGSEFLGTRHGGSGYSQGAIEVTEIKVGMRGVDSIELNGTRIAGVESSQGLLGQISRLAVFTHELPAVTRLRSQFCLVEGDSPDRVVVAGALSKIVLSLAENQADLTTSMSTTLLG